MAEKKIEWYAERAGELIDQDQEKLRIQRGMDKLSDLDWNLPRELENLGWMKTLRQTLPYVALNAGSRVLTGLDEHVSIDPVSVALAIDGEVDSEAAKAKANEWEVALKWQMDNALRRNSGLRDAIPFSALKYDEIAATLVHVPTQVRALGAIGANPHRIAAIKRLGQFAIILKNAKNFHVRRSDFGTEAQLTVVLMKPQTIVDFWGDRARAVRPLMREKQADKWYVLADWCDFDERVVWCFPGERVEDMTVDRKLVILKEPYTYSFLPTIHVRGHEDHPYPLLYGVWRGGTWEASNIIESLSVSAQIATFSQPKLVKQAPDPDRIETDYTEPGGEINVPFPPGTAEVKQLTQQPENPALRTIGDRLSFDIRANTVPSVLISAEAGPNEPFSGYNLRIRQAIATLNPFKKLSEKFFEETYRAMLYWCAESGEAIPGYGRRDKKAYRIASSEVDPDAIYLSVELSPETALDKQEKINTAVMAQQQLPMPWEDIAAELGIANPQGSRETWMREKIEDAEFQGLLAKIQADASGEIQQMAMQIAQGMMEQAQQEQGQAGPAPQGMNPAQGGQPAAEAAPGATREARTGRTKLGEERA